MSPRRRCVALAIALTAALVCFAADGMDLALDVADPAIVVAVPVTDAAAMAQPPARPPQPTGEDYDTGLYRADLMRPKQWGS